MTDNAIGALPRAIAARALDAVLTGGRNLPDGLAAAGLNELPPRDRSLASALAFGATRTHLRNRYIIDGYRYGFNVLKLAVRGSEADNISSGLGGC